MVKAKEKKRALPEKTNESPYYSLPALEVAAPIRPVEAQAIPVAETQAIEGSER